MANENKLTTLEQMRTLAERQDARDDAQDELLQQLNIQADLSQNDETAADFVKGRTHWEIPAVELLSAEFSNNGGMFWNTTIYNEFVSIVEEHNGETLELSVNGEKYEVTASASAGVYMLLYGADVVCSRSIRGTSLNTTFYPETLGLDTSAESYSVSIAIPAEVHPLDKKFIPESAQPLVVTIAAHDDGSTASSHTVEEIVEAAAAGRCVNARLYGSVFTLSYFEEGYAVFSIVVFDGVGAFIGGFTITGEGVTLYELMEAKPPVFIEIMGNGNDEPLAASHTLAEIYEAAAGGYVVQAVWSGTMLALNTITSEKAEFLAAHHEPNGDLMQFLSITITSEGCSYLMWNSDTRVNTMIDDRIEESITSITTEEIDAILDS